MKKGLKGELSGGDFLEMGRWGDGEMGRGREGEMGRGGDRLKERVTNVWTSQTEFLGIELELLTIIYYLRYVN